MLDEADVHARLQTELPDAHRVSSWGEVGYFFNPGRTLKRGVYICTVKNKDGANDKGSQLSRPGIYRVNIGLPPDAYGEKFGPRPQRPRKGGVVDVPYDFSRPGALMPHPVYAWMGWVCILNPSAEQFDACLPLIRLAEAKAAKRFNLRA